jgi:hypothetical protein
VTACVREGELGDPGRGARGDDLQALHHAGHDFMFEAGVEVLGVLAHDHEIDRAEASRRMRQRPDRAEVRVEIQRLAQADVHAGETGRDRRRHRSLEGDLSCGGSTPAVQAGSGWPVRSTATTPATCRSQSIETPAAERSAGPLR